VGESIPHHVMNYLKRDEDLASLIQISKVSYAKGFKNLLGIVEIG
jgi:hypothetical protein